MQEELNALEANHTWDIVPCPCHVKSIGYKQVFSTKLKPDGSLDRHKARLVALGNRQEYGIDYDETFTPVTKMTNVHTMLAIAALQSWPLYQFDVKNAFLDGDLKDESSIRHIKLFQQQRYSFMAISLWSQTSTQGLVPKVSRHSYSA